MFVYILCDYEKSVIKVGITRSDVYNRLYQINQQQRLYKFVVYGAKHFKSSAAYSLEGKLLSYLSCNYSGVPYHFGGSTECFIVDKIDETCEILWKHIDNYMPEEDAIPVKLERVVNDLQLSFEELNLYSGMSLTDFIIISVIKQYGSLSQQQIADDLNISSKTVERSIKALVAKSIIKVEKEKIKGTVYSNKYTIL